MFVLILENSQDEKYKDTALSSLDPKYVFEISLEEAKERIEQFN